MLQTNENRCMCLKTFSVALFIGLFVSIIFGWADYGLDKNEMNSWFKVKCNISTIDINPPSVCSRELCSTLVIFGNADVKGTTVSYILSKECKTDDTICLTQYFVGEILYCWYNSDNFWRFDPPASYDKVLLGFIILSTVYCGLFVLYAVYNCCKHICKYW